MKTTLNLIREQSPCTSGWKTLIKSLPTGFDPDQEFSLSQIVESNGVSDAIWCLRATTTDSTSVSQRLAIAFAEYVLPIFETAYPNDKRPRLAIQAARDYLAGNISLDELNTTRDAARSSTDAIHATATYAAYYAVNTAYYAARAAGNPARATATYAAYYTARAAGNTEITKIFLDMLKQPN